MHKGNWSIRYMKLQRGNRLYAVALRIWRGMEGAHDASQKDVGRHPGAQREDQ